MIRRAARAPWRTPLGALAGLICLACLSAGPALAQYHLEKVQLKPWEKQLLNEGEVITRTLESKDGSPPRVMAAIIIPAPVGPIWRAMLDCPNSTKFVPGLLRCKVLKRGPGWELIQHQVDIALLLPRMTYTFKATYKPQTRVDFARVSGDLKTMRGTWLLRPLGPKRTMVLYSVHLEPDFAAPRWLVRMLVVGDLPTLMTSLRKYVLSKSAAPKYAAPRYAAPKYAAPKPPPQRP